VSFDCNIRAKKLSNARRTACAQLRRAQLRRGELRSKRFCEDEGKIDHRENGYMSHAAPMPIKRNRRKDHAAYLIRCSFVCRVRQPRAKETNSANKIIAQKWLSMR